MEINIEIIPKYVKPEIQLLNMLIDDILKNKKLIYSLSEISVPNLKGSRLLFLERFVKKVYTILLKTTAVLFFLYHITIFQKIIFHFF